MDKKAEEWAEKYANIEALDESDEDFYTGNYVHKDPEVSDDDEDNEIKKSSMKQDD